MKRILMTSALVAAASTGAQAQSDNAGTPFWAQAESPAIHASRMIGLNVYATPGTPPVQGVEAPGADWEDIGEISDLVLSRDGMVEAVLIDIGGFLGIGERRTAIDMDALNLVSDDSTEAPGDFFIVLQSDRATLETAPVYEWEDMTSADAPMPEMAEVPAEAERMEALTAGQDVTATDAAPVAQITASELTGVEVYDSEGEWVGEVDSVVLSEDGAVAAAVVDVGGFLGIGEKPVELSLDQIEVVRVDGQDNLRVVVSMSRDQLGALPTYEG